MADSVSGLIYAEAQRALALQPVLLNELRSRTGILFAVANGITGLLGALVIRRHGVGTLVVMALTLFGIAAILCLAILVPLWKWTFSERPSLLIANYAVAKNENGDAWTPEELQRDLALHMEIHADKIRGTMTVLQWLFVGGVVCLSAELVLWLIALGS